MFLRFAEPSFLHVEICMSSLTVISTSKHGGWLIHEPRGQLAHGVRMLELYQGLVCYPVPGRCSVLHPQILRRTERKRLSQMHQGLCLLRGSLLASVKPRPETAPRWQYMILEAFVQPYCLNSHDRGSCEFDLSHNKRNPRPSATSSTVDSIMAQYRHKRYQRGQ